MKSKPHILVVDDDTRLRELLDQFLRDHGFAVTMAVDAQDARAKLALFEIDLMVLDVMMPKETGIEFARSLGQNAPPILLLTAMGEAQDRVSGLEAGADDYLVKPFEPRELVLRIQSILRRVEQAQAKKSILNFGEFTFDVASQRLLKEGAPIHLTTGESQLLKTLAEKAGNPVSREALAHVLGSAGNERSVDVQITRLRKKIEGDGAKPVYVQTVRGAGYMLQGDWA